jgi:hypothetical protein
MIFFFLLCTKVFALDAVITVLETPMFSRPELDAPVVQYLRKGDVIKLDPSVNNLDDFTFLDMFLPTLDRQGHKVYVISDHLRIYSNDRRELSQKPQGKDKTDYRLEEPLPNKYPLATATGYRGQFLVGVSNPYTESYPYSDNVKIKGYSSPVEFNINFLRQVPYDKHDRFYFGGGFNIATYKNEFVFFNERSSEERTVKIGVGPFITYDAYKGSENRLSLYTQIYANLFNQMTIKQSSADALDERTYRGINFAPRFGIQYHRKAVISDLDLVLGTALTIETPTKYNATNGASQRWWQNPGADSFTTRSTFNVGAYLGVQQAY